MLKSCNENIQPSLEPMLSSDHAHQRDHTSSLGTLRLIVGKDRSSLKTHDSFGWVVR